MNKRTFISFGAVAILLAVLIPLWAFSKDGSEASSPEKVTLPRFSYPLPSMTLCSMSAFCVSGYMEMPKPGLS